MNSFKSLILAFISSFGLICSHAQTSFDIAMQFRPRFEQRLGYGTLPSAGSKSAFFISERARLNVGFKSKYVKMYMSLQDVRTWGSETQTQNIASFALHEGWAEVFVKDNISFKLRRQELVYDDSRLFGNADWGQQARAHDAAVFKFQQKGTTLHVGGAFNQASEGFFGTYYGLNNYKALAFLWFNQKFVADKLKLSFYAVTDGFSADTSLHQNKVYFRGTVGPMLHVNTKGVKANVTFFTQFGKDTYQKDILAFFASAYVEYTVKKIVSLGVGYDFISGNDASDISNKRNNKFNTLYATNHKFYGHMDYFQNLPKDTKGGGLHDAYFKFKAMPNAKGSVGFDAHYFLLANKVKNLAVPGQYLKLPLGFELDVYGSYKPIEYIELTAGYSTLFAAASMEALKGGSRKQFAGWGFVMLNVNPTIFKWEKEKK
ncbi:MAG: hypothetical protein IPP77_06515 [Bacteroidetes bacterium]|nr:hypothetical protein [Bacteroidota bacterium]